MASTAVVIPTFNRARFLGEAVDSVLAQSVVPAQVIVVDDGSTDDTRAVAERYGERVTYLAKRNGGKSSALNAALPLVGSDYLWVFDDDDIALPDALERHLAILQADPAVGFTYSTMRKFGKAPDGSSWTGPVEPLPEVAPDSLFVALMEDCFVTGQPGVLARSDCYRQVGPFDEQLIRSQDYEMLLRLARNFVGQGIEGPTYLQRQHGGTRGNLSRPIAVNTREREWQLHDRIIFSGLYESLPLRDYLPGHGRDGELSQTEVRQSLLQRSCIMARKGLWNRAIADLRAVSELGSGGEAPPLRPAEREICRRALGSRYGIHDLLLDPAIAQSLRDALFGATCRQIRRHIADPLLYMMKDALQAGRLTEVRDYWQVYRVLVDLPTAGLQIAEKLGSKAVRALGHGT